MGVLDGLTNVVGGLLGTFGQTVTFIEFKQTYDVTTGRNEQVEMPTEAKALVEDYPTRDSMGGERNAGGILRGDKKVTVASTAYVPTVRHKVLIGGVRFDILKVDTQMGTDRALMYTCQCRR